MHPFTWGRDQEKNPNNPYLAVDVAADGCWGEGGWEHRVHRVATAAFWRTFSDEGKIGPGWWGWGVHAHPLLLHLPSLVKLQCTLQLSGQTNTNPVSSLGKYVLCGWEGLCDSGATFLRVHNRFIERQRLPLGTTFIYFLHIILLWWLCSAVFVADKDVRGLLVYLQM